jgi:putative phosphoesterase
MKILIISDLHANIEALCAVDRAEQPFDHVFCNGDVVDYGPSPNECIDWLRNHNADTVRGNHDHAVGNHAPCGCIPPYLHLSETTREVMWKVLDEEKQAWLAALPRTHYKTLGGTTFFQCHAAPKMISEYLPPETPPSRWNDLFQGIAADFVLLGHTHIQSDQRIDGHRFLNPGSVGQPKPRGTMAQYATWTDGHIHLKQVPYAYQKTQAKIRSLPLDQDVIEKLCWILEHGNLEGFVSFFR